MFSGPGDRRETIQVGLIVIVVAETGGTSMAERIVSPTGRGFLLLDAHPTGCVRTVERMREEAGTPRAADTPGPVVLVIGSSAGYGLAATIAGLARHRI